MPPEKTSRERAEDLIHLLVPDWRPSPWQGLWAIRIGVVLGLLVAIGYFYGVTLWDWIKLLIVPAAIAGAGLWFTQQQRARELQIADQRAQSDQEIADERRQDDTLQAYLDGMSQLLTDKERPLHRAQPGDSLRTVARARTLTVLGRLDSVRQGSVLQFLFESGLIYKEQTLLGEGRLIERQHNIVSLQQAYLIGADLSRAYLIGADLSGADLSEANLSEAYSSRANLFQANLRETNLSRATLIEAKLRKAVLSGARLSGAHLSGADLSGADLSGADLTGTQDITREQLASCEYLVGATMPDGQILKSAANPDGPTFEEWLRENE